MSKKTSDPRSIHPGDQRVVHLQKANLPRTEVEKYRDLSNQFAQFGEKLAAFEWSQDATASASRQTGVSLTLDRTASLLSLQEAFPAEGGKCLRIKGSNADSASDATEDLLLGKVAVFTAQKRKGKGE